MKLDISARPFAAIAQFRSTNEKESTPEIKGVYIEPHVTGGVLIMATNRICAGVWFDRYGYVERPIILRADDLLIGYCAKEGFKGRLVAKDGHLTVQNKDDGAVYTLESDWEMEGKYPQLRRVIPAATGPIALHNAIDPKRLKIVRLAVKIVSGAKKWDTIGLVLRQKQQGDPIVCTDPSEPNFYAVVMGVSNSADPYTPDWVNDWLKPAPAAPLPAHEPPPDWCLS